MTSMRNRTHKLVTNIPWHLELKDEMVKFYKNNNIDHPIVYKIFDDINDFKLIEKDLPNEFVLKPTTEYCSKGVMVLKKINDNQYYEKFLNKNFSIDEIINYQYELKKVSITRKNRPTHKLNNYKFIIEERLYDFTNNDLIPCDYKCFTFYGEVVLILRKEIRDKSWSSCWYDRQGNYIPHTEILNEEHIGTEQLEYVKIKYLDDMIKNAELISKLYKVPYCRVDFYITNNGPKIGEFGFIIGGTEAGGFKIFNDKYDKILGEKCLEKENEIINTPI
jgi:hypothetical protein